MPVTPPRQIELKGSPREIGLQHGRLLEAEIKRQMAIYGAMFKVTSSMSWPAVLKVAEEYRATIDRLTPDLLVEMQGIADGAGVDLLDIVALNCRSEIALGRFTDGCTSLAWNESKAPAEKAVANKVILAQNWDWTAQVKPQLVIMSIEQPGKPRIHMVTESGIIGKIGFNSAGVGTCLNAVRARPTVADKLPIHVALRLCLESTSVDEGMATLQRLGGVASSQHILLADSTHAVGMELSPNGNVYLPEDEGGIVTHSNHFIENRLVEEPLWLHGSPVRLARIRQLTSDLRAQGIAGSAVTPALLRDKVFNDTYNAPQAICCQEDPDTPIEMRSSTLFNIIMTLDPTKPSAEVLWGKPGSGETDEIIKMPAHSYEK